MTDVTMEWESRLCRRLRVRDLYILSTVVKSGTMGKAARALAMSPPAVSEAVAGSVHCSIRDEQAVSRSLEHTR
jgi:Bacterial regulatory helix-turn-helix protein, lysR family